MNFKKTLLAVALASTSVSAFAVPTVMSITGGTFKMGAFTPVPINYSVGTGASDITDQYSTIGWDVNTPQANGVPAPGAIASFQFGTNLGSQVNTFIAAIDPQAVDAGGHPMPVFNGSLSVDGTSTIDLSGFYANWNATDFNQGASSVTVTTTGCNGTSCNYSMAWSSLIVGGPFNGNTGKWTAVGTVSAAAAVPEASTYGMMVAGLGLVGFAARRRTRRVA